MGDGSKSGETLGRKARNELIHYALISLYLYICFGAMLFYRMAFLHAAGVSYAPSSPSDDFMWDYRAF
jgi:hypothetical protein